MRPLQRLTVIVPVFNEAAGLPAFWARISAVLDTLADTVTAQGILKPIEKWNDLERATNSFGQGVSGTTLQVAAAYNAVANDGLYVSPRLIEGAPAGERHEVVRAASARRGRGQSSRTTRPVTAAKNAPSPYAWNRAPRPRGPASNRPAQCSDLAHPTSAIRE